MALTDAFYEAVQSGNVRRVRIMMKDSLLVDPTFEEFDEMEEEAENMEGLYDEHDDGELIEDKSLWNDEYMNKLMVEVVFNFSHERIDHLKEVVGYLRPVSVVNTAKPHKAGSGHSAKSDDESSSGQYDHLGVKIGAGAAVGALIGGAIAAVADAPVVGLLGGIVAGALLGGVTTTIIVNGGNDE